jgi:hypothetical protein
MNIVASLLASCLARASDSHGHSVSPAANAGKRDLDESGSLARDESP